MTEITGQFFGILVTIGCIVAPFMKKREQILTVLLASNIFAALNFLLLEGVVPSVFVNLVATVQAAISLLRKKSETIAEKVVFVILYGICGIIGYKSLLDILPIVAAMLYMAAVFQKKEQNIRKFTVCNALTWFIYDLAIGTTAIFAQIISIISNITALYKYRNK